MSKMNRRQILNSIGATGAIGVGFAPTGSATEEDNELGFEIVETSELSDKAAEQEVDKILSNERMTQMKNTLYENHDLKHHSQYGLDITTNDSKINEGNIRFMTISFTQEKVYNESAVGFIMILTIDNSEEDLKEDRQPTTGQVHVIEDLEEDIQADSIPDSNAKERVSYKFEENGSTSVAERENIDVESSNEVTPNALNALCTGSCFAFVTELCQGQTGSISLTRCANVCARFLVNPKVALGCSAACGTFVRVINRRGCDVGAGTICASVCN